MFIELKELKWDVRNGIGVYVIINISEIGWYLALFERLHKIKLLVYILMDGVTCVLSYIFSENQYTRWFYDVFLTQNQRKSYYFCEVNIIVPMDLIFYHDTVYIDVKFY